MEITCDPSNVANNHHETILLFDKPIGKNTEAEITIEIPCPSTLEQPIGLDDADDVVDLTDDSEITMFSCQTLLYITLVIPSSNSLLTYLLT